MSILVVTEQVGGAWNRMTFEALAAGLEMGRALGHPVAAAVLGDRIESLETELAARGVERVVSLRHPLLATYTPDAYTLALAPAIRTLNPFLVALPHTYQVRDFAPKLAAALDRVFISDLVGFRVENGEPVFVRQLFQGKMNADVTFTGQPPYFVSLQSGAFRADALPASASPAPIERPAVRIDASQIRIRPGERFQEAKRTVDLASAEIIVAVGRGIKEKENLPLAEKLAQALGGELAASRPICDNGWLPMERQIGSSGQTVAPKLYVAVGISGAIQHLVGMKGSRVVVAINKDANAPIFEVADYGIVGNLFEVVPALTEELAKTPR